MSFFAILIALVLEQVRPLGADSGPHTAVRGWARTVQRNFDTGQPHHGWMAWALAVGLPTAVAAVGWLALERWVGWPAAMLWNVALLYVTVGFRQFSHHFTAIRDALSSGDEDKARQLLAAWQQLDASALPRSEVVRHVIAHSVIAAHRHVFGVLAWFSLFAAFGLGPAGAVFYRTAAIVAQRWRPGPDAAPASASPELQQATREAWWWIDWLPARLTAIGFAIVGNFEEAVDRWRSQAARAPDDNDGIILAATSGAVNVRLDAAAPPPGRPVAATPEVDTYAQTAGDAAGTDTSSATAPFLADDADAPYGREPMTAHLAQVVGLVWRSVVMWMLLLALLTLSRLLG